MKSSSHTSSSLKSIPKVSPGEPIFCKSVGWRIVIDALPGLVARGTMTAAAVDATRAERRARNFMMTVVTFILVSTVGHCCD